MRLAEVPDPVPGPGEVLLAVQAAAVNRADLMQRAGNYPPPPGASEILGLEAAGTIAALGPGVSGWRIGDRAMALLAGGGYADRVAAPVPQIMPIPSSLDLIQAAGVPEVFITAWMALVRLARLQPGETVLVHAAGGGVGTAAIQVARELGAGAIVATSRSRERLGAAEELGAIPVVTPDGRFAEGVRAATGGHGADVVVDLVGPGYLAENIAALAPDGRIVMLSLTTGRRTEIDFGALLPLRASLLAATLRARSVADKGGLVAEFSRWGLPRLADGRLRPLIDRVLPLAEAAEAHRLMADSQVVGKVVLQTASGP